MEIRFLTSSTSPIFALARRTRAERIRAERTGRPAQARVAGDLLDNRTVGNEIVVRSAQAIFVHVRAITLVQACAVMLLGDIKRGSSTRGARLFGDTLKPAVEQFNQFLNSGRLPYVIGSSRDS